MEEQKKQEISPWPWDMANVYTKEGETCHDLLIKDISGKTVTRIILIGSDEHKVADIACLIQSAPELRSALEDLVRRQCEICKAEMHVACEKNMLPCQIGETCGRGLDDARKAIAKSYWKKEQKTDEND